MFHIIKYFRQNWVLTSILIALVAITSLSNSSTIYAQSDAEVLSDILNYPSDVEVGEIFTFFIRYRCASSTDDCGEISIDAIFPDLIDIIDIQTGNADLDYTVSFDDLGSDADGNDIILSLFTDLTPPNSILCDNSTDDVCFTAGQTGIATITARVHGEGYFQTGGPDIPINVDSTANDPMGGTTTTTTSDTTTISEPEARYNITKVRTDTPESAAEPIPGNNVTYQITITPTSQQDNLALSNITLTDTLPPNSVFVSASDGGTETAPGSGTVEWTGLSTSFDASDQIQPITVTVTVNYPLSDFSTDEDPQPGTATSVINGVDYTGVAAQDPTGVCPGTCTGSTTNEHSFDPPTANPNVTKSIETNPVGIEGTGRYNLSIDNSFANTELTNAILTDVLPTDAGAEFGLPLELEAIEVGDREATILVSTLSTCSEISPDTDFTTLTGSPFAAGSTLDATSHPGDLGAGNAIKCIRWIWTDGTINAGGSIDGMQIRFTPRFTDADNDGNNDSGFSVPVLGATYTNCMRFDFVGPDPADPTLTPPLIDRNDNDCADVDIAGSDDNVSLASSKTGDSSVIPDDTIEFDINFNLTERSSQVLTNPVIIEALPLEFDVTTLVATISDPNDYLTDPEETAILASQTAPIVTNISGTNYNVIEWTLPDITPLEDENITFAIHIEVDLYPYIQNGIYTNYAYFLSQNDTGDLICETGILENDTENLDNDGVTLERCSVSSDYNVPATAILEGQKWIQNETNTLPQEDVINTPQQVCEDGYTVSRTTVDGLNDLPPPANLFSRYPCAADGIPGDSFTYSLAIRNTGNANIENYTLIDILPYPGDTEVIPRSGSIFLNRDSEWRPYLKPDGITLDDIDLSQDPLLASIPVGSQPTIAGTPIDDNNDVTIEYSLSSNPCRDEVATSAGCDPAPATWSFVPATPDDWKRVRAFKITANPGIVMRPADQIEITVEMEIPTDSPPDESGTPDDSLVPQTGEIIWNSYAHVGTNEVTGVDLLSAEPIKVGIRIPETVSVGNRVWEDINNSGDIDGTEAGIEGVTVTLYEWNGAGVGAIVDTTITDAEGYYIFNLIPDGIDPNNIYSAMGIPTYDPDQDYVVVVDADNFDGNGTNDELQDYVNSDGNGAPNNEDDADDTFVAGVGYVSSVFQLDPNQEDTADENEVNGTLPTSNDTPPADDFGALGRGSLGQDDNNSDLRKDFGFWRPMSIGNRVWFDTGAGAGETNNGIQDASEAGAGVANVAMSLYADDNADGTPDSTIAIATTTTDANGYYLFDQLSPGTYIVGVDISNFVTTTAPLFGYEDSDLNDTTDTDENDNGQTDTFQSIFGELSGPIVLEYNTEPTLSTLEPEVDQTVPVGYDQTGRDPDIPPDPDAGRPEFGRYGALDENSNLTVDFGFWRPEFALGNFVWDDIDNDSQFDTGESPIENVLVNLYLDANEDGTPDTVLPLTSTSTDATGYYFFDALAAGGYIVELDPSNWTGGGPLEGYISSTRNDSIDGPTGTNPPFTFPTEWDDQFDDGRNRNSYADLSGSGFTGTNYVNDGIRSETVTLVPESEAPGTENAGLPPNTDPDPTDGDTTEPHTDGNIGAAGRDFNSDLTVDFGVFIPLSLGNRVWQDNLEDPTGTKRAGDGIFDEASGEVGIAGVTVWLYKLDEGGDANNLNDYTRVQVALDVNATTLTNVVDTTDASGYYLFDGLGEGTYRVRIPRANFNGGVLTDFISSNGVNAVATTNSGDADDNQDSGIDAANRVPDVAGINGGIWSDQVVLTRDSEPTVGVNESNDVNPETDGSLATYDGPNGIGRFNEDDDNSDVTVDFGFFRPLSLGNRVWFDPNGDGDIDGTEVGIDGVTVQLFQDDGTGTFVQVAEVETANGGYYRFDGLQPDDYQVRIPAVEFQAGGVLVQHISTVTVEPDPNSDVDSNDNGIDNDDPSVAGISSGTVTLSYDDEPTSDTDEPAGGYDDVSINPDTSTAGEGAPGADNNDQNLSVDFGFLKPFSLGNRVWYDIDGDGVMDITGNDGDTDGYSAEVGLQGVTVNLYDAVAPTVIISTVFTDSEGYYRFDNLMPGDYIVEIPASEFLQANDDDDGDANPDDPGELFQLASSRDSINGVGLDPDADTSDFDDNGVDPAAIGDAVRSAVITLGPDVLDPTTVVEPDDDDDEPASYAALSIDPDEAIDVYDTRSNTTVDFGFFPYGTLGNYVWLDANNNNTIDGGEVGIGGVTVNLYYDRDGDGTVDLTATGAGLDGEIFSTVTASQTGVNGATEDGYYRFDFLPAGEYIVEIPSTNFDGAADALFGFTSSNSVAEPDPDADPSDIDDNGIDPLASSTLPEPRVDGVLSDQITLNIGTDNFPFGTAYDEPTGETEPVDYGTDAVEPDGIPRPQDINENLTVDFGFFQPLSIGNRVWFDDDAAGDIDAGELGVDGVTVILFDSGGTEIDRVETGNDGYYRFDNLLPGDYYIEIPATEFQTGETLAGYLSSPQPAADPDTDPSDTDDNGISNPLTDDFAANGIRSEVVTLEAVSSEPTGETEPADSGDADLMPDYAAGSFTGAQASDDRANLTVDFGFFKPMSLGNRVWYDANADGDDLDGEDPIAGVTLELYRPGFGIDGVAGNADDTNALYTVTTDTNGYYRFDSLPPGDYIVTIPGSNFATGVLQNYISSAHFGTDPTETDPNTNGDQNDNGINQATTADRIANGVSSGTVTLDAVIHSSNGSEPIGEVEPASYGAGATAPPTGFNAEDGRGNLTVDFGFYVPLALGNRVFNDDGTNGGTANDGIQNGDEPGIDGVLLGLYTNNAGSPGTLIDTFITQDNGYYIFDGLPAGEYIVVVEADNFDGDGTNDTLVDTFSSFFVPDGNDTDSGLDQNDNGIDNDLPSVNGIQSPPILLSRNDEPAASGTTSPNDDTDLPLTGTLATNGRNGELDENSDLTIDFGFQTPPMSIGNYVWYDLNNNGQVDTGENPVVPVGGQNIIVDLYRDNDANGLPDDLNGDSQITNADRIATTVLDSNGFYLFDRLTSGAYLTQGSYIVGLNFVNFRSGQILEDYYSSTTTEADPNSDGDQNDNGIDRLDANVGIFSSTVTLSPEDEPTLETPLSGNATDHGPEFIGRDGQRDTNSNVTVDFGLYKPMSIGNRVWFDSNDNGLIDTATENGVAGVSVTLLDNIGTPISSTTTDANGYYLFDNLIPGTYQVRVDPVNWTDGTGPLDNLPSSTLNDQNNPTAPNTDDSNDNGVNAVDETDRETNGILSGLIVLDIDSQPTSEGDRSLNPLDGPNFIGNNGESDNNSDITIDFGFVPPNMSLGNFIWYDYNNNGLYDSATEDPVEAVDVSLFRADAGGNPTGIALQTDTTDANGYYLFDLVSPGQYVVVVNATNFAGGNPLENYISSLTGVASAEPNPDDINDNGIDDPNPAANGIQSALIDLQRNNAPTGEVDLGPEGIGSADNDANSDLTIDFGFYQPMSLGNRVWFDVDDDGELDTTENGVGGVIVNLYDAGDLTTPISSTTTDTNGYYIFDGLIPGDYVVEIPTSEFGDGEPLENTVSSSVETPDTDDRDNGSNEPDPTTTPTRSGTITLELNNEPTGESEGPDGRGGNGETDLNSNLTVDFGFVPQNGYSLGNRVWIDADRDGLRVDTEDGVDGVALSLYLDVDVDGTPDSTTPIATTNTDADGYYIFDGLTAGTYIVGIDPSNFTGGPLVGYASTTPDVNIGGTPPDDDDNRASPPLGETFDVTFGILSDSVTLSSGDEPTGEADLDPDGTNSAPDDNSDLTIDFGFYQGLALGNHVWFDSNNDGIQDAGEPGIGNVTLSLYTDDGTGNPDTLLDTDTTDGNGYYLFNNLIPGDYIVVIDDTNFDTGGALFGYTSSPDADPTGDLNDNGIDDPDPLNNGGIISNVITLAYDSTPTGETDTSGDTEDDPNFRGINNETDNNSDLTVDFGFFTSTMSIGNYVWLDDGAGGGTANNGVIDGGELGIEGVELELYPADTSGNINGSLLDTTTTDVEGYYLFDNVPPGNYVILVTTDNFGSGDPLENLFSSDGSDGGTDDKDDNGIDDINPETNGILSELITLQSDSAPTTEIADNISSDTVAYGPNGRGLSDPTDENSDLTIDFGFSATYDWGDAPDGTDFNSGTVTGNYGTVSGTGGANHRIISTLHLGEIVDDETGNLENDSATADDDDPASADDEDGVVIPPLVAGSIIDIEVTVFNNTGEDAILIGWIDWNLDGDFDPEEAIPNQLPASDTSGRVVEFDSPIVIPSSATEQVVQIPVFVPLDSNAEDTDLSDGNDIYTFARFRLTTDTLDENDATGTASDGEVEDYRVQVQPPGLSITKTDGANSVVVGQSTTYTITIRNSGVDVTNQNVFDEIPIDDPDGFDPDSIEWTCEANALASCIAGDAPGTDIDTPQTTTTIDQDIDVLTGGEVIFTITATVRDNHVAATISNTATLESGPESTDEDGVIYDPPTGVKSGVINGDTITWTMTWINTGGPQAATITDPIQSNQTFAGNLVCNEFGTSVTTTCSFSGGSITWAGTIGTGNPNRIEISFDVTTNGSGPYRNEATIDIGGDTATAAASVGSDDDDDDEDDSDVSGDEGGYINAAPSLTKSVDTPFTLPGATVVWTIQATNDTNATITTINITDPVPSELTVTDVQSSSGDVAIDGQQITLTQGSLAPGESITITITTDVGDNVAIPFAINNPASLTCDCTESRNAIATIVSVLELPATGETPWWRTVALLTGLSGIGVGGLLVYHRKRYQ